MMRPTARHADTTSGKIASSVSTRLGQRHEAHGDLGDDAERAFAADDGADEIGPRVPSRRRSDAHDLAVGQHHLEREHVIRRRAVLQRMRTARVLGDVAADRAGVLARGIRRIEESVRRDGPRERRVERRRAAPRRCDPRRRSRARDRGASTRSRRRPPWRSRRPRARCRRRAGRRERRNGDRRARRARPRRCRAATRPPTASRRGA